MAVVDCNGTPLRVGDVVLVPCKVEWIKPDGDERMQNVNLQTIEPMFPTTEVTNLMLNSKQIKSVAPEVAEAIANAGVSHATAVALKAETDGGGSDADLSSREIASRSTLNRLPLTH